ncbi:hypothetical protein THAOC_16218, partial [Thalassiosira oceanica]
MHDYAWRLHRAASHTQASSFALVASLAKCGYIGIATGALIFTREAASAARAARSESQTRGGPGRRRSPRRRRRAAGRGTTRRRSTRPGARATTRTARASGARAARGAGARPPVPSVIGVGGGDGGGRAGRGRHPVGLRPLRGDGPDPRRGDGDVRFVLRVSGMTCGGCASTVSSAMRQSSPEDGAVDVRVDLDSGTASVRASASWVRGRGGRDGAAAALVEAAEGAGFEAELDAASRPEDDVDGCPAGLDPDGEPPAPNENPKFKPNETEGGGPETAAPGGPDAEAECGICLTSLSSVSRPVTLPCGHVFSSSCLDGWRDR